METLPLAITLGDPWAKFVLLIPLALCTAGLEVLGFFVCFNALCFFGHIRD
jgi:hypothetical protein